MSGRLAFVTKSPLTGTVTDSHMGGWSAARLRWAGFDAVLITGKAAAPVYLEIENGEVEIKDASGIWGMGIHDTVKHFGSDSGNKTDVSVMSIGQGRGERRAVRFDPERGRPRSRSWRYRCGGGVEESQVCGRARHARRSLATRAGRSPTKVPCGAGSTPEADHGVAGDGARPRSMTTDRSRTVRARSPHSGPTC